MRTKLNQRVSYLIEYSKGLHVTVKAIVIGQAVLPYDIHARIKMMMGFITH